MQAVREYLLPGIGGAAGVIALIALLLLAGLWIAVPFLLYGIYHRLGQIREQWRMAARSFAAPAVPARPAAPLSPAPAARPPAAAVAPPAGHHASFVPRGFIAQATAPDSEFAEPESTPGRSASRLLLIAAAVVLAVLAAYLAATVLLRP